MLSKLVDTFFSLLGLLAHQKIILADMPLSVQISISKCLIHGAGGLGFKLRGRKKNEDEE